MSQTKTPSAHTSPRGAPGGWSRRDWMKWTGMLSAATLAGSAFGQDRAVTPDRAGNNDAAAPGQAMQGAGFYTTNLGQMKVSLLSDGAFVMAPGLFGSNAPEGAVEAALKKAFISPQHIVGHVNGLLIQSGNEVVLVDTGGGQTLSPTTGKLLAHLAAAGVKPEQVSTVFITHAHPDHIGGLLDEQGKSHFPNAELIIDGREYEFWTGDNPDLSKSGLPEPMQGEMSKAARQTLQAVQWTKLEPGQEKEIRPGITTMPAYGHTPGHRTLLIKGGDQSLYYITDAIHNYAIQMPNPGFYVAFDTDRDAAAATRKKILDHVAAERLLISGGHLPFPAMGHVRATDGGYEWVPIVWEW